MKEYTEEELAELKELEKLIGKLLKSGISLDEMGRLADLESKYGMLLND